MNNALVVVVVCGSITFLILPAVCHSQEESISVRTPGTDPLEARFLYSITILKDLNEKILALDHHLTSLQAHKEVFDLANPLNYPEFTLLQDYVKSDLKVKHSLDIPDFLGQNAVFTSAWTLVSLVLSDKSANEKSEALANISCLLDFTMRMQQDLNIIYYETDFLGETNDELSRKCSVLFTEHCKLIGYDTPLQKCRERDEWENVSALVSTTFHGMHLQSNDETLMSKINKEKNDLCFRIDLTVQFVQEYTSMIAHGVRHYQKFQKILTRYESEESCVGVLPPAFAKLKEDVRLTLEKFETAYRMPELFGSRLKMLMYGMQ
jgi:hypothetical protein